MLAEERKKEIAKTVEENGKVLVNDLAEKYQVTKDLIRKDLTVLENEGVLKKVYGGAIRVRKNTHHYTSYSRKNINREGKWIIAHKAISLIHENDTIYLDISITSVYIAQLINENHIHCKVITGMIDVLNELSKNEDVSIFFLGGFINKERDGFWSATSLMNVNTCHIDIAFLGLVGMDIEKNIISTYQESDGVLKTRVMELSNRKYALADAYKFNEDGEYIYAKLNDFDALISDDTVDKNLIKGKVELL